MRRSYYILLLSISLLGKQVCLFLFLILLCLNWLVSLCMLLDLTASWTNKWFVICLLRNKNKAFDLMISLRKALGLINIRYVSVLSFYPEKLKSMRMCIMRGCSRNCDWGFYFTLEKETHWENRSRSVCSGAIFLALAMLGTHLLKYSPCYYVCRLHKRRT